MYLKMKCTENVPLSYKFPCFVYSYAVTGTPGKHKYQLLHGLRCHIQFAALGLDSTNSDSVARENPMHAIICCMRVGPIPLAMQTSYYDTN